MRIAGAWRRLLGLVRAQPHVRLVRIMAWSSPLPCLGLLLVLVAAAGLSVVFIVVLAEAVGSLPAAVRAGSGSAEADRTLRLVVWLGAVFAGQQAATAFQPTMAGIASRSVDLVTTERVLQAAAAPETLEHLDDPVVVARLRDASLVGTGYDSPGSAAFELATVATRVFGGLAMIAVVASYRIWMGLLLLVAWAWARREAVTEIRLGGQTNAFATPLAQRGLYFRELVLRPEAAKETRIFGLGPWLTQHFRDVFQEMFVQVAHDKGAARRSLARRFVVLFGAEAVCLVLITRAAIEGDVELRRFVLLIQAFLGVVTMSTVQNQEQAVLHGAATIPAIEAIERDLAATVGPSRAPAAPIRDGVVLEDVSYRYPSQTTPTLEGLHLTIPAGRSLALVGPNGAGKTTVVKLLTGLVRPSAGRVVVDDRDLRELDPGSWRRQFGVVFQDFTHYQLSAEDNVRFGAVQHAGDLDDLRRVAARAGIADVLEGLPGGWKTVLTRQAPGGADLSGGEWQRLALARALWAVEGGATFLVLDEPTAALDVRAEAAFYERFLDLTRGLTTVVVSHRFSTVRRADRVAVIDGGRVTDEGTHDELLAREGLYSTMYRAQVDVDADADADGASHA